MFFFGSRPPPHPHTLPSTTPLPQNHTYAQYYKNPNVHGYISMFRVVLWSWGASVTAPITGGIMGASDAPMIPPSDTKVIICLKKLDNG